MDFLLIQTTQYVFFQTTEPKLPAPQITTYKPPFISHSFPERAIAKSPLSMAFSMGVTFFQHRQESSIPTTENCCESCCESILPVCDLALPSHSSHSDPRGMQLVDDVFFFEERGGKTHENLGDILVDIT